MVDVVPMHVASIEMVDFNVFVTMAFLARMVSLVPILMSVQMGKITVMTMPHVPTQLGHSVVLVIRHSRITVFQLQ